MKKPRLPTVMFACIALSLSLTTAAQADEASKQGIRDVQQVLEDCGFNPGPIDGVWGNKTTASAKSFLQAHGKPSTSEDTTILMAQVDSYRIGNDGPCPDKVADVADQTSEKVGKPGKPVDAMVDMADQTQEGERKNPTEQLKTQIKEIVNKELGGIVNGWWYGQKLEITFQENLIQLNLEDQFRAAITGVIRPGDYEIPLSGINATTIEAKKIEKSVFEVGMLEAAGIDHPDYLFSAEIKNGKYESPGDDPYILAVEKYNNKYYWARRSIEELIEERFKVCWNVEYSSSFYSDADRESYCAHAEKDVLRLADEAKIELFIENEKDAKELEKAFKQLVEYHQDNNGNQSTDQSSAKCYEWVSLGEFNIGKWVNGNGHETGSPPVGSDTKFHDRDELETQYKVYHSNCESAAESALDDAIKAMILVGRYADDIENERKQIRAFYQSNFNKCQAHFTQLWEKYEGKFCE